MKRWLILGFALAVTVILAVTLSFGSIAEEEVAVKLHLGRVVKTLYGPTEYFHIPIVEHVHLMQRRWTDKISVENKYVIVNIEITDPKVFFLTYSGSYQNLLQKLEARFVTESALRARLSADSDIPYQMAGVDVKLRAEQ